MPRKSPRYAQTDPQNPRGWATCVRCGFIWNHFRLRWQYDWRGLNLVNRWLLVCPHCLDTPQRQLGAIVIPPDPRPIYNARPEAYQIDETPVSTRVTMDGRVRTILSSRPPYRQRIVVGGPPDTPHTP